MSDWKWHPERPEGDRWVELGAPEPETTLLAAATPADILAAGGILRAPEVVELAAAAGLDLAAAAVVLLKESGGGNNVWGHDNVVVAPNTYAPGAIVTKPAYLAYRQAVLAGRAGKQGIGPLQLTWLGYVDEADQIQGAWDWRSNVTVGFRALAGLIKNNGMRSGFRHFNGAGPAAEAYADDAMSKYLVWKTRLGTPEPAGDGDMTDEDRAMLVALYQFASGSVNVGEWPGWPTWPGGTNQNLSATDYLRQANVQLVELQTSVDALASKPTPAPQLRLDVDKLANNLAAHPAIQALAPADDMGTVSFWKATAEQAVTAFAASMLTLLGAGVVDVLTVPWTVDLRIAGGVALVSVLKSLVGSQLGDKGTPSFLRGSQ